MGKMVSASEFKAKCLQLIAQMEKDGETVTITRRGKAVAELTPSHPEGRSPVIGMLRSPEYFNNWDPGELAGDPGDWEALR